MILILQFNLSPEWVFDKAHMYEINKLFEYSYLHTKTSWEQTRFVSWVNACGTGGKKVGAIDKFLPFEWDNKKQPKKVEMTKEQYDKMKEQATNLVKNIDFTQSTDATQDLFKQAHSK